MKLLVIDDHPFIRYGLQYKIQLPYPDCEIVEADTAEQGIHLALTDRPDLVLLDLILPWSKGGKLSPSHGLAVLDALRIAPNAPPIIVISALTEVKTVHLVQQRGAAAVVPKDAAAHQLWEAIARCLPGMKPAGSTKIHKAPVTAVTAPVTAADLGITPRMFDVLRLSLQGNPSKRIAQILDINDSNVRRYLSRLYRKFGVAHLNGLQAHFGLSGQINNIVSAPGPTREAG